MKNVVFLPLLVVLIMSCTTTASQKYRTASDTTQLNVDRLEVINNIAELTSKLTIAKNNLQIYLKKANDASEKARTSAIQSSIQSTEATNGNLSDAKSAKKKADRAYEDAQDSKSANNKLKNQDKKIAEYNHDLEEKQKKLQELDRILATIRDIKQQ